MLYGCHTRFDDLPALYQGLFDRASRHSFYALPAWFQVLAATTLGAGDQLQLVTAAADDGRPLALLPAVARGRRLDGLANVYSCAFAPLWGADVAEGAEALAGVLRRSAWTVIDIPAMPAEADALPLLAEALWRHGLPSQAYFHFGNWYEVTAGLSFATYLAQRPSALRNTLRRHRHKLAAAGNVRFGIVHGGTDLEAAIAAYDEVYRRSWKRPEPHPAFIPALARAAAELGALRMGLMHVDGEGVAAQLWLVWRGKATIFKLGHDEAFDDLSPGSLLTAHMMRHILDHDHADEVDFGRGDDDYKKLWLPKRRERWGLRVFNPRTATGLWSGVINIGGSGLKKLMIGRFRRP